MKKRFLNKARASNWFVIVLSLNCHSHCVCMYKSTSSFYNKGFISGVTSEGSAVLGLRKFGA